MKLKALKCYSKNSVPLKKTIIYVWRSGMYQKLISLRDLLLPLENYFNSNKNKVRFLSLLSPT
jgi:hypothetical protein